MSKTIVSHVDVAGLAEVSDTHGDEDRETIRLALSRCVESLSPQARQVLDLVSEGHPNRVIASRMSLSESAVKSHVTIIMKTFGCSNRTQAALLALFSCGGLAPQVESRIGKMVSRGWA